MYGFILTVTNSVTMTVPFKPSYNLASTVIEFFENFSIHDIYCFSVISILLINF